MLEEVSDIVESDFILFFALFLQCIDKKKSFDRNKIGHHSIGKRLINTTFQFSKKLTYSSPQQNEWLNSIIISCMMMPFKSSNSPGFFFTDFR